MTGNRRSLSVLLIEDEAMIAMLLEDMLADLGHQVAATAGRVDHAMRLSNELPIDLAIIDVNLNGEQTYPLATLLASRQIPFVFATGYGADGLQEEWRNIPVLQKPFQLIELAEAIVRATGGAE
jgi:CheY-like chemotaxis protein